MKKKNSAFIIYFAIIIALTSTTIAYMFKQTEYKINNFVPAQISCEVIEVTNADVSEKREIKVKNNSNIAAYIRIRLISYWTDDSGITPKASQLPEFTISSDWIEGPDDIYYYKKPIEPNQITSNLFAEGSIIGLSEDAEGNKQVIEIFAEAIQSTPKESVIYCWNVSVDSSGNIISINAK